MLIPFLVSLTITLCETRTILYSLGNTQTARRRENALSSLLNTRRARARDHIRSRASTFTYVYASEQRRKIPDKPRRRRKTGHHKNRKRKAFENVALRHGAFDRSLARSLGSPPIVDPLSTAFTRRDRFARQIALAYLTRAIVTTMTITIIIVVIIINRRHGCCRVYYSAKVLLSFSVRASRMCRYILTTH